MMPVAIPTGEVTSNTAPGSLRHFVDTCGLRRAAFEGERREVAKTRV